MIVKPRRDSPSTPLRKPPAVDAECAWSPPPERSIARGGSPLDRGISSERAARNQSLYRSLNEKILELQQTLAEAGVENAEWICECADTDCTVRVVATLPEYEKVRSN